MNKETVYEVVIEKRHCEGRAYFDNKNCPLCAAIKEQIPDFKLKSVGGDYVRDTDNNLYFFDARYKIGWEKFIMSAILSGEVQSHKVTFSKKLNQGTSISTERRNGR